MNAREISRDNVTGQVSGTCIPDHGDLIAFDALYVDGYLGDADSHPPGQPIEEPPVAVDSVSLGCGLDAARQSQELAGGHADTHGGADLNHARELYSAGLKLCALHPNSKRPVGLAWNRPENCVQAFNEYLTGYGLPLAINNRCSIDPDDVEMANIVFSAWGFDYDAVMSAGVRTTSTRPGSGGRSQFKAAKDLKWITIRVNLNGINHTVLELRATSPNLQDVIPGLTYLDAKGNPCTQTYANGRTFLDAPDLPSGLRDFWEKMSDDMAFRAERENVAVTALATAGYPVRVLRDLSGGGLPFPAINKRLRALFNEATDVEALLTKHRYEKESHGRYSAPNATGAPGIRRIKGHESLWQSDHGSDPLRGTFDAAAISIALDFEYDEEAFEVWVRGYLQRSAAEDFGGPATANDGPTEEQIRDAKQKVAQAQPDVEAEHAVSADHCNLEAVEYTLDGFLSAGVTYIAGGHGIGKSSLLIPLASIVSGELPAFEQGINAFLHRRVIYITEDPAQAQRVRYGLKKHNGLKENGNFTILQARRRGYEEVESSVAKAVEKHTLVGPKGYAVKPLIVFDTTNACFDVENENDAAEVGRVMSALKTAGNPVWIIGHLAKAIARNDLAAMTGRGSGAWEADAQCTAFIFAEDENTPVRYIATKKRRFEPTFVEVKYHTHTDHEFITAPWGEEQCIGFRYGVPERSGPQDRREAAARQQLVEDIATIEEFLRGQKEPVSKATIEKESGVGRNRARDTLDEMVRLGIVANDGAYRAGNNVVRKDGYQLKDIDFNTP